ncbi:MAG: glycosyltransferase [Bacteroidaceae bacterium]|nr:glycosyltransferase [Bacteroidaceae bacterium]
MKLSVVTINYNNLHGLRQTVGSMLKQTFHDYEWIVVDGGSSDGSCEFLDEMKAHFAWLVSEPDRGIYNALNKGARMAKGEFLYFLNSGDELYAPDVLQRLLESPEADEADMLYGDVCFCYPDREDIGRQPERLTLQYLRKAPLNHQSTLVRRECFERLGGFDERFSIAADWRLLVQMKLEACRFVYVPGVVCRYDMGGISYRSQDLMEQEREQFFEELVPAVYREALDELYTFDNKPCIQTRDYCAESRCYRRWIRSLLHVITWFHRL